MSYSFSCVGHFSAAVSSISVCFAYTTLNNVCGFATPFALVLHSVSEPALCDLVTRLFVSVHFGRLCGHLGCVCVCVRAESAGVCVCQCVCVCVSVCVCVLTTVNWNGY